MTTDEMIDTVQKANSKLDLLLQAVRTLKAACELARDDIVGVMEDECWDEGDIAADDTVSALEHAIVFAEEVEAA
jgi:hypothetical protein